MNLLLTGPPRSGKTTAVAQIVARLAPLRPVGFYTREIREHGERTGFMLVSLDGDAQVFASVHFRRGPRVGRYRVDVGVLEAFLDRLHLLEVETKVVVIDEIGKMECLSQRFVETVRRLLDSDKLVLATVALKGHPFIEEVRSRPDCMMFDTRSTPHLVNQVYDLILHALKLSNDTLPNSNPSQRTRGRSSRARAPRK